MSKFTQHQGVAAPLYRANIDTDADVRELDSRNDELRGEAR